MTIQLSATLPDGRTFKTKAFPLAEGKDPLLKAWSMFEPSGSVQPAARILGAHVYCQRVTDDLYVCAVRVSNGAANPDSSGHPGKTYYSHIDASAPGWMFAATTQRSLDSGNGPESFNLVSIISGSHVFPSGASFVRRFALYRGKTTKEHARTWLDKATRAELLGDATLRRLPAVPDQEPRMAQKLRVLRDSLAKGIADNINDLRTGALGPFQPPGSPLAYEHGGQGIYFVYSWEQCYSGALFWRTISDLYMERMPCVFDITTGERITPEQWAKGAGLPYQPFSIFLHGDEESKNTEGRHEYLPPAFDRPAFNTGSCPYEQALANYDGIDGAHLIRALGPASAVAAQLHDPVARDFVLDLANWCRMSWCDIGLPPGPYRSGLPTMRSWGGAKGGQGRPSIGREGGWVARAFADGIRFAPEGPEKAGLQRNGQALLSMALFAAMPSGLSQRARKGEVDSAWAPASSGGYGVPADREITQCFEFDIWAHGALDLMDSLGYQMPPRFWQRNALLASIVKGAKALHDSPMFSGGQPKYVTVAKAGQPALSFISEGFGHDDTHVQAIRARLWRATKDKRWLQLLAPKAVLEQAVAKNESWNPAEWSIEALSARQGA